MMKHFAKASWLGAAGLMVLLGACSRKEAFNPGTGTVVPEVEKALPVFRMEVSAGDPGTKTVIDDASGGQYNVLWQAGDALGVYEVGNGIVQEKAESEALTGGGATASFVFSLSGTPSAPYDYTFVYPASALHLAGGHYLVTLPATQTVSAGSFDPAADILVSEHIQADVRPTAIDARFARLGGTARMVIKAPSTSETIERILFSSTEGNIVGTYELNPSTGELSSDLYSGSMALTLVPATSTPFSGEIPVWFRLAEVTLSQNFTVSVRTNLKTYTKTVNLAAAGRSIEFRNSSLTTFNVNFNEVSGVENIREDVIDAAFTGVTQNQYTNWSGKTGSKSEAVYAGQTAKRTTGEIGLRTNKDANNHYSGIVATASGGKVQYVTLTLKAVSGRRVDVYAKNAPYNSPDDLWDNTAKGSFIGSVSSSETQDVTGTVDIPADYNYVALRSYSGAVDVVEIRIGWDGTPVPTVNTESATDLHANGATLSGSFLNASGGIYEAGFYWDTDEASLEALAHPEQVITTDGTAATSGNFSCELGSLDEVTDYYYRAYILWLNPETNTYQEYFGPIKMFTTQARAYQPGGWLEMPSYSVERLSGTTTSSLADLYPLTHRAEMGGENVRNYSLLYDPEMFASYWVAYPLCLAHTSTGRNDSWSADPDVPAEKQTQVEKGYGITWDSGNYSQQTYARGHQIPNADRNGVAEMQRQTYYATNVTPQLQNAFNGSIWGSLEGAVRDLLVNASDTVYVCTGPAYRKKGGSEVIQTITNRDGKVLPIPNYYWKVLLKVKWSAPDGEGHKHVTNAAAIGFWFEHKEYYPTKNYTYTSYTESVDQIEEWTGLDFFSNLSSSIQDGIETSTNWTSFKNF